jgi:fibronectin-binding autotransporter adhesin
MMSPRGILKTGGTSGMLTNKAPAPGLNGLSDVRLDFRRKACSSRLLGTTALAGLLTVFSVSPGHATDWTGAVSNDWFNAGNWTAGVPNPPLDQGFISTSGPNAPIIGAGGVAAPFRVRVGDTADGTLTIENGGTLNLGLDSGVGYNAGVTGTVTVIGSGSKWIGGLLIGVQGTGVFYVAGGGSVVTGGDTPLPFGGNTNLGYLVGSTGTVTVDGIGSSWADSIMAIGVGGTGTLNVTNGGNVRATSLIVGAVGTGSLNLADATVTVTNEVDIARDTGSTGTLTIGALSGHAALTPGTLNSPSVVFGNGSGTVVFNHTSSNYTFAPAISGRGSVLVESGTTIFTGANTYSNGTSIAGGTLEVSGPGGRISSGGDVAVGTLAGSTGSFNVTNGGKVTDNNGSIGNAAGATGNATVTGAGSNWTTALNFVVGNHGDGSLTVQNGGTFAGNVSYVGYDAGVTGTVVVDGSGSQVNNSATFGVGYQGRGLLLVVNGGAVNDSSAFMGVFGTAMSGALVAGAGSAWNSTLDLGLGLNGQAALTIADGATVSVGRTLTIATNAGSTGTLYIGALSGQPAAAAGALITPSIVFGSGAGSIVFNHTDTGYLFAPDVSGAGSMRLESGTTVFTGTSSYSGGTTVAGGTLQLGNGGTTGSIAGNVTNNAALAFNHSNAYDFVGVISGNGVVQQNGTGTTTLTATNLYTGGTIFNAGTLSVASDANLGGAAGALTFDGGTLQVTGTAFTTTGRTINWGTGGGGFNIADAGNAFTVTQVLGAGGALTKLGVGSLILTAANAYVGGTTIAAGTLQLGNGGTTGSIIGDVTNNGILVLNRSNTYQFDGAIAGSGAVRQIGSGTTVLTGNGTYTGVTTISGGVLQLGNGGTGGSIVGDVLDNATLAVNRSDSFTFAGQISGTGTFQQIGTGTTILTNGNTYSGGTTIADGTLRVENNAALGTGAVTTVGSVLDYANGVSLANPIQINSNHTQLQVRAGSATQAGIISELNGPRPLEKIGPGSLVLSAMNTYTGPTTVIGGALDVEGAIASSSLTTVNAGAALTGIGVVGNTTIANGGAFLPGNGTPGSSMTVSGNLAFQSGAIYLVQVNSTASSFANVSGSATVNGTVSATYANGSQLAKRYTILSAAGGISGAFSTLANTNLPANFSTALSYDPTHAYLDLTLTFTPSGPGSNTGPTGNQQTVANGLIGYFNANGGIPMAFGALTPAGLTQVSGEAATATQQATFDAMNLFMGVLTDPFVDGRGGNTVQGSAAQFAPDGEMDAANAYTSTGKPRSRSEHDAYAAAYTMAPPRSADPFASRWSVWAAGYGGSQTTDGNAVMGSHTATSRIYGVAAGADYRLSSDTLLGFALAGGGTNFSIANGLGSGLSNLFQAGVFIRHNVGAAYLAGALAYGWQDVTADRTVTIAGVDQLRARFNANAFSGRVEGGYRFAPPWMGLTPYAAGQFATYDLPAYAEQVSSGASTFALSYASKSVTASRSELGLRANKSFAIQDSTLTLRGRAAWAHDFNTERSIAATFQTLPGASFVVNGAAQAHNAGLITSSAEMKWQNGFSLAATFEGEFSNVAGSYAGKGVARYAW